MLTDKRTKNRQMNRQNYINFERNLAMMVIYLTNLNSIGESIFEVESGNENVDGQTDGHRTHQSNRQVGYTQPASKIPLLARE